LIYVPLPTKALAMPGRLPPEAAELGYDPEVAASVYDGLLAQLRGAGIETLDARQALRRVDTAGTVPVYRTDPRLAPGGVEALSLALADLLGGGSGEARAVAVRADRAADGERPLASPMRTKLQTHCLSQVPMPLLGQGDQPVSRSLHAARSDAQPAPQVALVGSEIAVDPALGLADRLAARSGLSVAASMVAGEDRRADAFGAISSYLSSPDFENARPEVLIWVNPVWLNLSRYGSRPLRELIALAGPHCTRPIALSETANGVRGVLGGDVGAQAALRLDSGGTALRRVEFHFTAADGEIRRRIVDRHPEQHPTSRMVLPLAGLWPEGATSVEILADTPWGARPSLTLCEEI
ncbi:MAG: hypothetical protein AAGF79_11735, partial [Pseudomonadota bacterium]